ncbi:MAG: hypothetical protein JO217_12850 [Acidobacteriaceae bacterium]|nr:hypothetical protein [Acidobacteriaceae bacterium]
MNARTIRRAQQRRAAKEERKAARISAAEMKADPSNTPPPKAGSDGLETKSPGSGNVDETAIRRGPDAQLVTGITGSAILLPTDEAVAYSRLVSAANVKWQPVGEEEQGLVQSLVDTEWRLMHVPALEAGIYALGRLEFAQMFNHEPNQAIRRSLIEAHVFIVYQRQLNNLAIQESRLRRQHQKDSADLRRIQEDRQKAVSESEKKFGFEFASAPAVGNSLHAQASPAALPDVLARSVPRASVISEVTRVAPTLDNFGIASASAEDPQCSLLKQPVHSGQPKAYDAPGTVAF